MTPLEALTLAVSERYQHGAQLWRSLHSSRDVTRGVADIAAQFDLAGVLDRPTSALAYGKQRLLEIALAFACHPRVLLLDEPAAGVPENEREEILSAVARLPRGVSVILIEHDMDLVFRFATRISVLVDGALLMEGTVSEVSNDPRVRAVYLGGDADA
jgi:branched-chain amino acid transport system ATP-binding protein